MSDLQPDRPKLRPRRAEPWQPDLPGRGTDAQKSREQAAEASEQAAVEKRQEQAKTALENTRNGYT